MGYFSGKVAFVTGGASGIGRAVAEQLTAAGARVTIADINEDLLQEVVQKLGTGATGVVLDVRDADEFERLVHECAEREGKLDLIFNNAGIIVVGDTVDTSLADWNRVLDINVRGVVNGVFASYSLMVQQGFGHIVNTASVAGLSPSPGIAAYCASKFAVVGLSLSLRAEALAKGVQVSVVCPGVIKTPIMDNMEVRNVGKDDALGLIPVKPYDVTCCARDILEGVRRNRARIIVSKHGKALDFVYRHAPSLVHHLLGYAAKRADQLRG